MKLRFFLAAFFKLTMVCVFTISCVTGSSIPPEETYAYQYGNVERPTPESEKEAEIAQPDEKGTGEDIQTPFEVETQEEADDAAKAAALIQADQTEDTKPVENNKPTEITNPAEVAELTPIDSQLPEKTPPYSPLAAKEKRQFNSLEERLYYAVETSYNTRDPYIFKDAYTKFVTIFPNSMYLDKVNEYNHLFYGQERLNTRPFNAAIFDPGFLSREDYALLDYYFSRAKEMGFEYVLWKPFVNIADYYRVPPPAKGDVGALYKSSIIQMYEDRMSQVLRSAEAVGLKVLISFPLRDHPWIKYNKQRLPEDTWFPGPSSYGMSAVLNLLHPEVEVYLVDLLKEIVQYKVAGIVFENDFTHHMFEGFHELNLLVYEDEVFENYLNINSGRYNKNVQPRTYFRGSIFNGPKNDFAYQKQINSERYQKYVTWRIDRIGKLFQSMIGKLRFMNHELYIGAKTASKLVLNKKEAMKVYGVAPAFILNLPTDFIIMDNGLYGTIGIGRDSFGQFQKAAEIVSHSAPKNKDIYLKETVPSNSLISTINLNTEQIDNLRYKIAAKGLIVGNLIPLFRKEYETNRGSGSQMSMTRNSNQ